MVLKAPSIFDVDGSVSNIYVCPSSLSKEYHVHVYQRRYTSSTRLKGFKLEVLDSLCQFSNHVQSSECPVQIHGSEASKHEEMLFDIRHMYLLCLKCHIHVHTFAASISLSQWSKTRSQRRCCSTQVSFDWHDRNPFLFTVSCIVNKKTNKQTNKNGSSTGNQVDNRNVKIRGIVKWKKEIVKRKLTTGSQYASWHPLRICVCTLRLSTGLYKDCTRVKTVVYNCQATLVLSNSVQLKYPS